MLSNKIVSLLILCCFVFIPTSAFSAGQYSEISREQFSKAALYYDEKKFDRAILEYEELIRSGAGSGNIYYNLGNCFLRKGDAGKAILSYSRTRLVMPRDADLLANYRYALSLVKQKDARIERSPVLRYIYGIFEYLTIYETFCIFAVLYIAFTIFFVAARFVKKLRMLSNFITALSLCLTLVVAFPLIDKVNRIESEAIVVVPVADAKIEPVKEGESLFPLYDGMKVRILKSLRKWHKIKRPDGKIGWVSAAEILPIKPQN